jgi:hypothetical protein
MATFASNKGILKGAAGKQRDLSSHSSGGNVFSQNFKWGPDSAVELQSFSRSCLMEVFVGKIGRCLGGLIAILLTHSVDAQEIPVSPRRAPQQDWTQALEKQRIELPVLEERGRNVFLAFDLSTLDIAALPVWSGSLSELHAFNRQAWAVRPYNNPNPGNFNRRAPWLYPADGCYAKAAHISSEAAKRGLRKPGKVFAFGNLSFRSPYASNGRIAYWSYHVAAAYQIEGQALILDPTINSQEALTLNQWLSQIARIPEKIRVRFCDAASYSPSSPCRGGRGNGAYLGHLRSILRLEWRNLISLGYSPSTLLAP